MYINANTTRILVLGAALILSHDAFPVDTDRAEQAVAPDEITVSPIEDDLRRAPIRSRKELDAHIKKAEELDSPLLKLSEPGYISFVDSLVFTDGGVGSFATTPLEQELTPTEIHDVLALFGLQRLTAGFENARIETERDQALIELEMNDIMPACPVIDRARCKPPATCEAIVGQDMWCVTCNCKMH